MQAQDSCKQGHVLHAEARYICPVLTPFTVEGKLDEEALKEHIDWVLSQGVQGILLGGSSGEFYALSFDEMKEYIATGVRLVAGRVPVMVGSGRCSKEETVALSHYAFEQGADAVMLVGPYYSATTSSQIFVYFDEVLSELSSKGKVYLYNYPERMGYDLATQMVYELRKKHESLAGIKDTHSVLRHSQAIVSVLKEEFPGFEVYTGYDNNCAGLVLSGGDGCIGALSNVVPALCADMIVALNSQDFTAVAFLQQKIDKAFAVYEAEVQFNVSMKWMLCERSHRFEESYKAPLKPMEACQKESLQGLRELLARMQAEHARAV